MKVEVDVTAGSWFSIDKYFTSGSIFLHWWNIILIVNETRQQRVAMNFGWSLKPVFVLLAVTFGIDLDRSKEKSEIGLCLTSFLCFFWLVCFNIPLNLYYVVIETRIFTNTTSNSSFVYNSNMAFNWMFCAIFHISIHILILVSTNGKWKTLWKNLLLLQQYIGDEGRFYRKLRHYTIQGLMIFSAVSKAQTYQDLL